MTAEDAAKHWEALAGKEDRWAAFLDSRKATHLILPERPDYYRRQARNYRNVALSIRITEETGQAHCCCTTPPHVLPGRS